MKKQILTIFITAILMFLGFMLYLHQDDQDKISAADVRHAQQLIAMDFTAQEIDTMLEDLNQNVKNYGLQHQFTLKNENPPSLVFNPVPEGFKFESIQLPVTWNIPDDVPLPASLDQVAFYTIPQLASLIKSGKMTSTRLTQLYLDRIDQYEDTLLATITVTRELALQQAKKADEEIRAGHYRGPLHGIPYGVKDLLAVKGYKTTWGSNTHKDQVIDQTATVVRKLEEAGAVLIAKLTSGALARGDVWFGGTTKNPWDLTQGASGSSAGPASATVAGLVGFSIGTETMGSIVSPSTRCGASGLRPTYGRVSRAGVMTLSWSLDKVGPICRSAEDCAIVFQAIHGKDEKDPTTLDAPFNYTGQADLSTLNIGYVQEFFEKDSTHTALNDSALAILKKAGASLTPVAFPSDSVLPVKSLNMMMYAEAGAAFDDLTRMNLDDSMVRQDEKSRPNALRQSRFIPAVEYIQASRFRYQLIQEMYKTTKAFDAIVAPTQGGSNQLLITNMTGQPVVVVPIGFDEKGHPVSMTIIGNLYDEATILAIAKAYQEATDVDEKHPEYFLKSVVTASAPGKHEPVD